MKKIALLCTILSIGQLYGMHEGINYPQHGHYKLGALPPEVKTIIISYLHTFDKLSDIVKAIKAASLTNKELHKMINEKYGNQKGFAILVQLLLDKYNVDKSKKVSAVQIASQFHTPASRQYVLLHGDLFIGIVNNDAKAVTKAIDEGLYVIPYDLELAKDFGASEKIKQIIENAMKK